MENMSLDSKRSEKENTHSQHSTKHSAGAAAKFKKEKKKRKKNFWILLLISSFCFRLFFLLNFQTMWFKMKMSSENSAERYCGSDILRRSQLANRSTQIVGLTPSGQLPTAVKYIPQTIKPVPGELTWPSNSLIKIFHKIVYCARFK